MTLSAKDKALAPHRFGYNFEHTTPQRRVPCVMGNMLAPLSADDILPITPEAMASVQAALTLLADMIGDRDLGLFMGSGSMQLDKYQHEAQCIRRIAISIAGILRITPAPIACRYCIDGFTGSYEVKPVDVCAACLGTKVHPEGDAPDADLVGALR